MDIKLTMFPDYLNWVEGTADDVPFAAKLYDEPSDYGINRGRVSKLGIGGLVNYDRGWDFGEDHPLVKPIVDYLEQTPIRFYGPQEHLTMQDAFDRYRKDREERGLL